MTKLIAIIVCIIGSLNLFINIINIWIMRERLHKLPKMCRGVGDYENAYNIVGSMYHSKTTIIFTILALLTYTFACQAYMHSSSLPAVILLIILNIISICVVLLASYYTANNIYVTHLLPTKRKQDERI